MTLKLIEDGSAWFFILKLLLMINKFADEIPSENPREKAEFINNIRVAIEKASANYQMFLKSQVDQK